MTSHQCMHTIDKKRATMYASGSDYTYTEEYIDIVYSVTNSWFDILLRHTLYYKLQ